MNRGKFNGKVPSVARFHSKITQMGAQPAQLACCLRIKQKASYRFVTSPKISIFKDSDTFLR